MDIFGNHWKNHPERIKKSCDSVIEPEDLLLMPGDISWAMKRPEANTDLQWIADLPGIKVLTKGNHDYWWDSDKPLNFPGLYDTPYISSDGNIGVAGTRGWTPIGPLMSDEEKAQSEKITAREIQRLTKRLSAIRECPLKIALIHYPPTEEFAPLLLAEGVSILLYGHLHVTTSDDVVPENWHGIKTICVACDRINFTPRLIATL